MASIAVGTSNLLSYSVLSLTPTVVGVISVLTFKIYNVVYYHIVILLFHMLYRL